MNLSSIWSGVASGPNGDDCNVGPRKHARPLRISKGKFILFNTEHKHSANHPHETDAAGAGNVKKGKATMYSK